MSGYLWKAYLQDDVATFRAVLDAATVAPRIRTSKGHDSGPAAHSPADGLDWGVASPPRVSARAGKLPAGITLSRADLNRRDSHGRTLLHLAASAREASAVEFAQALLDHPLTDIYAQDEESGWTALHRAFYQGNMTIAIAILTRDMHDAYQSANASLQHPGGLIKIKDHEGNGPFDVLEQTFSEPNNSTVGARLEDDTDSDEDSDDDASSSHNARLLTSTQNPLNRQINLKGQEVFTFGSNKNLSLGFGDEDDRQFPERIVLRRPESLVLQFFREYCSRQKYYAKDPGDKAIPFHIRQKALIVREVEMGKFSTAVLTDDPVSNVYICGHGSGGRLGLGDERTRFQFVCVQTGELKYRKTAAIALGYHHTLALTSRGEVFSWGSNQYGQLGYAMANSTKAEDAVQLLPRQIYGPLRKEIVVGIAASGIHSVIHTANELFTFGKNKGQLGIVDSDARSWDTISVPRKVGGNKFSSTIRSVAAIDNATICLLTCGDVWVYANYGYTKISFMSDFLPNHFTSQSSRNQTMARYDFHTSIVKIAASGDTIAALSDSGKIFTLTVSRPSLAPPGANSSTTNPAKIRGAVSIPVQVWANRKSRLAAKDVAVDQNGLVVLVTEAGSVWRRVKRAKIKERSYAGTAAYKPKDYKFSRISGLTSIGAIRASGAGAYAAVRQETPVSGMGLSYPGRSLDNELLKMSLFKDDIFPSAKEICAFAWFAPAPGLEKFDAMFKQLCNNFNTSSFLGPDVLLATSTSEIAVPVHSFMLGACSPILRKDLLAFQQSSTPQLYSIDYNGEKTKITFNDTSWYCLLNIAMHVSVGFTMYPLGAKDPGWYRPLRAELVKLATQLDAEWLEKYARNTDSNQHEHPGSYNTLTYFFKSNASDPIVLPGIDTIVQLEDGERKVHAALMCQRSPFFKALFEGRSGGKWIANRQNEDELVPVDMTHATTSAFDRVVKWAYTDMGEELFKDMAECDVDDFVDHVLEVMGLANELMIKPLAGICQTELGPHVSARNVCQILMSVAPCEVQNLKMVCLKYIFKNFEAVMRHGQLDELDEDILFELDETARKAHLEISTVSRSGILEDRLLSRNPGLEVRLKQERQAKIDSIVLFNKYTESIPKGGSSFVAGSFHETEMAGQAQASRSRRRSSHHGLQSPPSPTTRPVLRGKPSASDLIFDMDGDDHAGLEVPTPSRSNQQSSPYMGASAHWTTVASRSGQKNRQTPEADQLLNSVDSHIASTSPSIRTLTATPTKGDGSAWPSLSPLPTSKLNMRDILDQASVRQPSGLSLGLSETPTTDRKTSGGSLSIPKMSQKERKKLQHQAMQNVSSPIAGPSSSMAPSPWQAVPKPKSKITDAPSPITSAGPPTPHLTMRQTVANPSSKKSTPLASPPAQAPSPMSLPSTTLPRTTSAPPHQRPTPHQTTSSPAPAADSPIQPRSIRHTPMPVRPSITPGSVNLSDIQSQQVAEKLVLSGSYDKRSLSEIQAEQAFQEWWDKESARVQGEDVPGDSVAANTPTRSRGGRGGARGGRGGRKRGGKADADGGNREKHSRGKRAERAETGGNGEASRGKGTSRGRGSA
ncbi:hypothetical protein BT63DRAFT_399932 [Microthyrium microscopicum]|uniref:BTB domain-containing protein n=1 Tax=Microthyrium microscopicum TaxID=703497 RepID=A0A6A6UFV8_9PEZI|nr:hypothetical protein BT63DRAFT_399932 [Microthyrium microscopicum]